MKTISYMRGAHTQILSEHTYAGVLGWLYKEGIDTRALPLEPLLTVRMGLTVLRRLPTPTKKLLGFSKDLP